MDIVKYNNSKHRDGLILLWKTVFSYSDKRSDPSFNIDNKVKMKDDLLFVAVDDDVVVGSIMGGYDGHRGWIYSLAVYKNHRGKGLGSMLLRHVEGELIKKGAVKINLQIISSNSEVVDFYNKNGYKVEERISMGKEIPENIPDC